MKEVLSHGRIFRRGSGEPAHPSVWVTGLDDGAGQLPVPGRPTTLAYGRAGACWACSRCGMGGLFLNFFFISSILSSFSNASSLWRWLVILKYCGLSHYNPMVVVSYY